METSPPSLPLTKARQRLLWHALFFGGRPLIFRVVCATPTIACSANTVTITCTTPGATIHYTTDGSAPTESSATYSAPFAIDASCTVKAIAVKTNYQNSGVASADCVYSAYALYTITSKTAVSTYGTAPAGSAATYSQTYSTASQMTSGNSTTLTLSGYDGKVIKAITLSMKSNTKGGAGTLSVTAGSTTIASIDPDESFNSASWYGAWSTEYVDVNVTLSNSTYTIGTGENIVIAISATANSLYVRSYNIAYE